MRLTGFEAIQIAEQEGLTLNKLEDPINEAATGLTIAEAEAIAADDPDLIWVDVDQGGNQTAEFGGRTNMEPLR